MHVGSKATIELQKAFNAQGREQKGHSKPQGINREQNDSLADRILLCGKAKNHCEYRSDARRPTERECKPDNEGAPRCAAAFYIVETLVRVQRFDLKQASQMKAEKNNHYASYLGERGFVPCRELTDSGGKRPQGDEDNAETKYEQRRIEHDAAEQLIVLRFEFLNPRPRNQRNITWHQRQHAWRKKGNESGDEGRERKWETRHFSYSTCRSNFGQW